MEPSLQTPSGMVAQVLGEDKESAQARERGLSKKSLSSTR